MKQILPGLAIVLFLCISVFAQVDSNCPTVKLLTDTPVANPGDVITFTIESGKKTKDLRLKYKWTISNGEIISGQETSVIKVTAKQDSAGNVVTAAVEITGFTKGCKNSFSETVLIPEIIPIDNCIDYNYDSRTNERARLSSLKIELDNTPNIIAVMYLHFNKNATSKDIKKRIKEFTDNLSFQNFPKKDRIIIVIEKGKYDYIKSEYEYTQICLWKKGFEKINCNDCEIIRDLDDYLRKPINKKRTRN